jgi:hypothetical protein
MEEWKGEESDTRGGSKEGKKRKRTDEAIEPGGGDGVLLKVGGLEESDETTEIRQRRGVTVH